MSETQAAILTTKSASSFASSDHTTSKALPAYKDDIALLKSLYTFNNSVEIKKFLQTHVALSAHLVEAHKQIVRVFGDEAVEICLEYANDPEENFEGLFVIVKTTLPPAQSLDLLDRFDEEWFLDHVSSEIGALFAVTVRPI